MAGRPKGTNKSKSKYNNLNKYNELNRTKSDSYEYEMGQQVVYIGGLHDQLKNKTGVITKQSSKGHRIDYSVRFEDGTEINCILETVLEKVEVDIIDDVVTNDIIESEE